MTAWLKDCATWLKDSAMMMMIVMVEMIIVMAIGDDDFDGDDSNFYSMLNNSKDFYLVK